MLEIPAPLRLRLDGDALVHNWRWLARQGGAAAGAAIKANGYGLGANGVMERLFAAGCRDFFVATWAEAAALMPLPSGARLSVLHGVRAEDMAAALTLPAVPVLNNLEQVARWRASGQGRRCDIMVDTGMNRLGLRPDEALGGALDGLTIETVMSHLASADEDSAQNAAQLGAFSNIRSAFPAARASLANSAGICLGADYGFDLTRPGLALYGGIPRTDASEHILPVVTIEAQLIQRRMVPAGESVGYGATWTSLRDTPVGIANLGYADGFWRAFAGQGFALAGDTKLPLVGRVSMDLIALDLTAAAQVGEGDWIRLPLDLPVAAEQIGKSQYELLTGLGQRFERVWA
ncbi:MAG: alanine racemase [Sphingopyxis sp.]|nr:alanine racemase [Sphingopyxis sp.]